MYVSLISDFENLMNNKLNWNLLWWLNPANGIIRMGGESNEGEMVLNHEDDESESQELELHLCFCM